MAAGVGGMATGSGGGAYLTMLGWHWYNARQGTQACGVFAARLGHKISAPPKTSWELRELSAPA